jgi:hypothetical protein
LPAALGLVALFGCGPSHAPAPTTPGAIPPANASCTFALEIGATTFDAAGGSAPIAVTTGPGCRWMLDTSSWIHPAPGARFVGSAALAVAVDPNRSFAGRSGSVIVTADGQVAVERPLVQRGAGCLYTVDPAALTFDAIGTYYPEEPPVAVPIHVHAEPADCRWTASLAVPWLELARYSPTAGTGDAVIDVVVAPNLQPASRSGEVVIAGLSGVNPDGRLVVTQTGR